MKNRKFEVKVIAFALLITIVIAGCIFLQKYNQATKVVQLQIGNKDIAPSSFIDIETPRVSIAEFEETTTQNEGIIEPTNEQEFVEPPVAMPEPKTAENLQATTPPTAPRPQPTSPKNGDARIINGQKQGYLLGFSWVDNMGENTCTTDYDMYENGNKIGTMGDINKIVGSMD